MKKIAFVFIIIVVILVIAAAIFLITFDANRYRPYLEKELEKAFNSEVTIDRISLAWKGGIALEAKGISVRNPQPDASENLIEIESIKGVLELMPLFHRQIQLASIIVERPSISLVQQADGTFQGFEPPQPQTLKPVEKTEEKKGTDAALPLAFLIQEVNVVNGIVSYRGASQADAVEIRDIDVQLNQVVLNAPMQLQASAAFANSTPNVKVRGIVRILTNEQVTRLEDFKATLDLSTLDLESLFKSLSADSPELPQMDASGMLELSLNQLILGSGMPEKIQFEARLTEGRISSPDLPSPLEAINAEVSGNLETIELTSLTAQFADGNISASGSIHDWMRKAPALAFRFTLRNADLSKLAPVSQPDQPSIEGKLMASFDGRANPPDWNLLVPHLQGAIQLQIENGVILNLNLLKETLNSVSVIPGLVPRLMERMPPEYEEKLKSRNTRLQPVQIAANIQNGVLSASDAEITAEEFTLVTSISVRLTDLVMQGQAFLKVDPGLSEAMIKTVNELQYLAGSDERIEFPVMLRGTLINPQIIPDIQFIARKLALSKTQELVSSWLQPKQQQQPQNNQDGEPSQASSANAAGENRKASLFDVLLENVAAINQAQNPDETQSSSQQTS